MDMMSDPDPEKAKRATQAMQVGGVCLLGVSRSRAADH